MNVKIILTMLAGLLAQPALAQGFAGMGSSADGFASPSRDTRFSFPLDHAAHPDFRIEWWYVTANLTGEDGKSYGIQWTLFRSALAPHTQDNWQDPQIWMGHAAVTSEDVHLTAERFARGGIGQAGVEAQPFAAWIDDWQMAGADINAVSLSAQGTDFAYRLELTADGPLVPQGDQGYSVKSASGQASYYYSQPFYQVRGQLDLPGGSVNVHGNAWLDREWSSQPLAENQSGWDWISLTLEGGTKLMGFRLRQSDGSDFSSGTWINANGIPSPLAPGELQMTPLRRTQVFERDIPVDWQVELPNYGVDVTLKALNDNAWMDMAFPYWEGPVTITGSHEGVGYLEMTGYE